MSNYLFLFPLLVAVALGIRRRWQLRAIVSGVVVDAASGRPLPGLRVELHPGRGPEQFITVPTDSPLQVVVSDASGAFRFDPVDPAAEYLLATRAGPGSVAGGGFLRLGRRGMRHKLRLAHLPRT
jgi:hypothetical protein